MKKVLFERKAYKEQIVPQDDYTIEKVVELSISKFNKFLDDMLADYDFIKENKDLMYVDKDNIWHAIYVTAKDVDYGILIQSEGYGYARYSAFLRKCHVEVQNV
ncbi:MAG: DUF6329 domain-containing protein [Acholeplasmataceae bacterium]|jgi:hypothetical protein